MATDNQMDRRRGNMRKRESDMTWVGSENRRDKVDGTSSDGSVNADIYQTYLTTREAARYLRRSVSWMSRRKDIPVYRGRPNVFRRSDLDTWMTESRRYEPLI